MNSHTIRKACKALCDALDSDYAVGKRADNVERYGNCSITIPIINKKTGKTIGKIEALSTRTVARYASVVIEGDDLWIQSSNSICDEPYSTLREYLLETIKTATTRAQKLTGRTPSQAKRVIYVRYGDD